MYLHGKPLAIPAQEDALPGRDATMPVTEPHMVNGRPILPPFPDGLETLVVGMGCFWGAERRFWETPGVWATAVGYTGGHTPGVYVADEAQRAAAEASRDAFAPVLAAAHFDPVTTEVVDRGPFFYAETYHQQYLARNPMGYCGLGGTGLTCPTGVAG